MVYLQPDKIRTVTTGKYEIEIKEKIIPDNARANKKISSWVNKGDLIKPCLKLNNGTGIPKGIVIHNTNDIVTSNLTNPAEQYTRATWPNCNMAGAVVHFYVYKSEIWQNLDESEQGWHAGDGGSRRASQRSGQTIGGNIDCIAIECIGDLEESERTTALLAAYLLKKYKLDADYDLYTHKYFMPSKNCPLYILPRWDSFKAIVKEFMNDTPEPNAPEEKPVYTASENNSTTVYFPKSAYTGTSLVDALKAIKENSTFLYRKEIAKINGIDNYSGTARENTSLLNLLKQGILIKSR